MNNVQTKILVALSIIAIAVLGAYAWRVLPGYQAATNSQTASTAAASPTPQALPSDPVLGTSGAAKTIIEFGDFECPYCAQISQTVAALIQQHPDTRLIWKDCPLPNHPEAAKAAEAARCAGRQGQYWPMHDLLLASQDQLGDAFYKSAAAGLKLDTAAFAACLDGNEEQAHVQASLEQCAAVVTELPWFDVKGQAIHGSNVIQELTNRINS